MANKLADVLRAASTHFQSVVAGADQVPAGLGDASIVQNNLEKIAATLATVQRALCASGISECGQPELNDEIEHYAANLSRLAVLLKSLHSAALDRRAELDREIRQAETAGRWAAALMAASGSTF